MQKSTISTAVATVVGLVVVGVFFSGMFGGHATKPLGGREGGTQVQLVENVASSTYTQERSGFPQGVFDALRRFTDGAEYQSGEHTSATRRRDPREYNPEGELREINFYDWDDEE